MPSRRTPRALACRTKNSSASRRPPCPCPISRSAESTGGSGIHLYVYADEAGIPTENHTVHSALARCILGMASSETGFDFASQIDACGGNMWAWHRKMTKENEGLKLLKAATKVLGEADLPANWRDHIEVVTRRRSKIRVHTELGTRTLIHSRNSHRPGRWSRWMRPTRKSSTNCADAKLLDDLGSRPSSLPDAHLCPGEVDGGYPGKYAGIFKHQFPGQPP